MKTAAAQDPGVRGAFMRAAAAAFGAAMLAVAALAAPLPALVLTGSAALALGCSLAPGARNWTPVATLTASAAVVECVIWPPGTAALAVEGLLILGYLVLIDAPRGTRRIRCSASGPAAPAGDAAPAAASARSTTALWMRGQARYGIAGAAATGLVLGALTVPAPVSPWVVLAGLAAVAAAYLIALPRRERPGSRGCPPSSQNR
jgi:hypothetical protein